MVSIVIPNYNGRELLRRNLPSVLAAAERESGAEVVVVDDASRDDSLEVLRAEFPAVRVVALPRNVGFGEACMAGVRAARGEIVVLLNSDVRVEPDFIPPLLRAMSEPDVFSVSAVDMNEFRKGRPYEAKGPRLLRGFLVPERPAGRAGTPYEVVFTSGGQSAYRKGMFLALGGFSRLYAPFYWEDADICYRAWKRGWRSLVEPASRVYHDHQGGSIRSAFRKWYIRHVSRRNKFLFTWHCLSSRRMLLAHALSMGLQVVTRALILDFGFHAALAAAAMRFGDVVRSKRAELRAERLSDEAVFKRLRPGR